MPGAIGSSTSASPAGSGQSGAGLEALLAKCQVQLSDWVACPSGKTPEGKAKIAALSERISDIQQRMKAADAARQQRPTVAATDGPPAGTPASPAAATGPLGRHLDVFA